LLSAMSRRAELKFIGRLNETREGAKIAG